MDKDIQKLLIKRLFLVWLVISILSGALVFYFSMGEIDRLVEGLAEKESRIFSSPTISDFLNASTPLEQDALQSHVEKRFSESHFIVVELYDVEEKKIVEVVSQGYHAIESEINEQAHNSHLSGLTQNRTFFIKSRIYLQIITPLKIDSTTKIGFFEGIYEVDEATMRNITGEMTRSILEVLLAVLATTLALYPVIISLNKGLIQFTKDLMRANIDTLRVLGGAIAKRDSDTHEHNYRVTLYAIRLAEIVGIDGSKIQGLIKGAFLHDVGKIAIPDAILLKPGKLTKEEFITMQSHVLHGVDIIKGNKWLKDGTDVVRCHHEKFDGTGYPTGLKGSNIPIAARVFIICDVFDALTSTRRYKEPFSLEKTILLLQEESGIRFDPEILNQFIEAAPSLHTEISLVDEKTLHGVLDRYILAYF